MPILLRWVFPLLTFDAGDKAVSSESGVTGALRLVVDAPTGGVPRAGVGLAHRAAGLAEEVAGLVLPTVGVGPAADRDAGDQRVALEAGGADAAGLVEVHAALGATAARPVAVEARVEAVLVDAGAVDRTLGVRPALGWREKTFERALDCWKQERNRKTGKKPENGKEIGKRERNWKEGK